MGKAIVVLLLIPLLASCGGGGLSGLKERTTETLQTIHDEELDVAEKLTCSSSIAALKRRYGDDPEKLQELLRYCDFPIDCIHQEELK